MTTFEEEKAIDTQDVTNGKDVVISLQEAAEILNVSYSTVYRLVSSGELFAFRIKNCWRTSTAVCRQYLSKQITTNMSSCQNDETNN